MARTVVPVYYCDIHYVIVTFAACTSLGRNINVIYLFREKQNIIVLIASVFSFADTCNLKFANSLHLDQDRQKVGPDLDQTNLTLWL